MAAPVLIALVCLSLAACQTSEDPSVGASGPGGSGQSADVPLAAMNGGQSGSATLLESPQLVLSVTIALSPTAPVEEPAAIVPGTCAQPGSAPAFPLTPVAKGKSTTTSLNTTLDELASSPHVVLVERSGVDSTLVACGPIPQVSAPATP